jgi:putative ABC transport system permease protein
MRVLDRKVLRDLWKMRISAIAIVLVLGCGVAILVMAVGMRGSLERTRLNYYAAYKMADLAVSLVRAPTNTANALPAIPGVSAVETRVTGLALLDLPGLREPASAHLISLPQIGRPRVNDISLAKGRWPDPDRAEEVLVNDALATANGFQLGEELAATLHGQRHTLHIVGIANSPEFVFVTAPGEIFPQQDRFGVLWMGEEALARAYDLEGAFNNAVFRLSPEADPVKV